MGTVIPKETFERFRRQRRLKSNTSPAFGRRFPSQSELSSVEASFPFSLQDAPFQYHEGYDLRAIQEYEKAQQTKLITFRTEDDEPPLSAC